MRKSTAGRPTVVATETATSTLIPKFCKDCRHCTMTDDDPVVWFRAMCERLPQTDLVTGRVFQVDCSVARSHGGQCGPDAKLFEPRETEPEALVAEAMAVPGSVR